MKRYIVTVKEAIISQYTVEAKTKEDASERFETDGIFSKIGKAISTGIIRVEIDES
jgi:hypothetical protein